MIWIDPGLIATDICLLQHEDDNQMCTWGIQKHAPAIWMLILSEEVGELAKTILEHEVDGLNPEDIQKEAIQVATLALKIAKMAVENNT